MLTKWIAASLFFAAAIICLGFGVALVYEAIAVGTGKFATISEITHGVIETHTRVSYVAVFVAGGIITGLLVHFTGWKA